MLVPSMLNMADVMADSCYTEEQVFDLGISRDIVFLVVVPLIGACRVPPEALSHFMAGDDDYTAEGMPEHYSGALSGRWTIKRERLRILPASWGKWVTYVEDIQALCERQAEATAPSPAPVGTVSAPRVIHSTKARRDPLTPVIELAQKQCRNPQDTAEVWAVLQVLAEKKSAPLIGVTEDGLQYLKAGAAAIFKRDSLRKRLDR